MSIGAHLYSWLLEKKISQLYLMTFSFIVCVLSLWFLFIYKPLVAQEKWYEDEIACSQARVQDCMQARRDSKKLKKDLNSYESMINEAKSFCCKHCQGYIPFIVAQAKNGGLQVVNMDSSCESLANKYFCRNLHCNLQGTLESFFTFFDGIARCSKCIGFRSVCAQGSDDKIFDFSCTFACSQIV